MSTLDPLGDFYLPGPAAREAEPERELPDIRPPGWRGDEDSADFGAPLHARGGAGDEDADDEVHDRVALEDPEPDATATGTDAGVPVIPPEASARSRPPAGLAAARRGGPGSLLLAALLLSGLGAGGWYLLQPDTLPIRRVNVQGEFRQLSQAELQTLVLENLRGGFFSVDVGRLREVLQTDPWVREVRIRRAWPDGLDIAVREQTAVARWNDSGLVNGDGDYFAPPPAERPADLPQLRGPDGMQAQLTEQLLNLQTLLAPLGMNIRELSLSERRAWSFVTAGGLRVMLGREHFDERLQRFIELVPASLGDRLAEAAYIDMRYTNGFAVRFNEQEAAPAAGVRPGNGAARRNG